MTDKERLVELAEQVEAATGPDRELDFYIWAAINGVTEITNPAEGHPMTPGRGGRVEGRDADGEWHLYGFVDPGESNRNWSSYGGEDRYPPVTASLDAALTLVPEGASFDLRTAQTAPGALAMVHPPKMRATVTVRAATPALALTAACLRARASEAE